MRRTTSSITIAVGSLMLLAGCGSDTAAPPSTVPTIPPGAVAGGTAPATPVGPAATPTGPGTAQPPSGVGTAGAPATLPPPTPTMTTTPTPSGTEGVPCAVAKTVSDHCTLCHGSTPQAGAPMALMKLSDFSAPAKSAATMTVAQIIPSRINATEQARLMPPVGSTAPLVAADKTTFMTWLSGGAKGVTTDACAITEPPAPGEMPTKPATAGGTGGASLEPIDYQDPEMKCYKFLTHARGDMDAPYEHGPGEEYVNFTFKAPWTGTVYTRAHKLAVDNAPILHHWLLYVDQTPGADGGIAGNSTGIHPSSNLLHAWAPGASPLYLDPDVGMKLTGTVGLTLEAHINNATGTTGQDHSGAEICVTTKVPTHVVDMTWTGSENIVGTSATGTCTPAGREPIRIIAAQPHMHKKGTHMKVILNRANGMKETLHDADFSFDNQQYYLSDKVLMPGDTFTTTCTYSAPATFGQSTNNEMCYWFPIAWPAGAMASGGGIHGPTACLR